MVVVRQRWAGNRAYFDITRCSHAQAFVGYGSGLHAGDCDILGFCGPLYEFGVRRCL